MDKLMAWSIFTLIVLFYGCGTNRVKTDEQFRGMWQLDKFEAFDALNKVWEDDTTRIGWQGYILYDGKGHMGVHLIPKGYKDFDTYGNLDSLDRDRLLALAKFYRSNFVYFSNYDLTDSTVEHKRLSATEPRNWGTSLVRDFEFVQDTLILTAHENLDGQRIRLRWIKMK